MASQKFTHISVDDGDDDEFVVQAGIAPAAQDIISAYDASSSGDNEASGEHSDEKLADVSSGESDEPDNLLTGSSSVNEGFQGNVKSQEPLYETQTEEDLQVPPMSAMQRGIIIFAIIMLIVAAVYYFGFMH